MKKFIAEFIGTFFLVFFGCGSIILSEVLPGYDQSMIPFVFGGTVAVMIYALGHISGAHFNPAVTLAFWCTNHLPLNKVLGYLSSQILGALLASSIHFLIWGKEHSFGITSLSVSTYTGFGLEIILTFALMFVIISVATDTRGAGKFAGAAIGTTVAVCALVGGPLTGASMNPARSIAPVILSGQLSEIWLYILAPIIGACLGAIAYERIR